MSDYGSQDVKCPFYKGETKKEIKCEGEFTKKCVFEFDKLIHKRDFMHKYCNTDYKKCPHFQRVNNKYPP